MAGFRICHSRNPPTTLHISRCSALGAVIVHTSPLKHITDKTNAVYSVSKEIPPEVLWQFFQNGWEFFDEILRVYYTFLSTLDYGFLFS